VKAQHLMRELADTWVRHLFFPEHGKDCTAGAYVRARTAIVSLFYPDYPQDLDSAKADVRKRGLDCCPAGRTEAEYERER
jgi:hypothetical protein